MASVVLLNALFAFVQERRSERAADRLQDLLPGGSRCGEGVMLVIDARDLVVDDVVVLEAGDRISADLRCVEAHSLRLDTSTMTGESVPVGVEAGETLHAGTFVTEGEGTALVTAIGHQTRLAGIARMATTERPPPTPLAVELHRVVQNHRPHRRELWHRLLALTSSLTRHRATASSSPWASQSPWSHRGCSRP